MSENMFYFGTVVSIVSFYVGLKYDSWILIALGVVTFLHYYYRYRYLPRKANSEVKKNESKN